MGKKRPKEEMTRDYLVWDPIKGDWQYGYPTSWGGRTGNTAKVGKKRLGGKARTDQIKRLAERDGMECRWCTIELVIWAEPGSGLSHATIDHYPQSKAAGGDNSDGNAVLACKACNVDRSRGVKGLLAIESRRQGVIKRRGQNEDEPGHA